MQEKLDALLKEQQAAQDMRLAEQQAAHDKAIAEMTAEKEDDGEEQAEEQQLTAIAEGQNKILEAILALTQATTQPKKKSGTAKLPSGGTLEFSMTEGGVH
jgi:hypothetical protein